MSLAYTSLAQRFEAAREAYGAGRPADAARLLDAVLASEPRSAPAHHLMGLCLMELGDLANAERALRTALSLDKRRPAVHVALAGVMSRTGRATEAEKAYRAGLAIDRMHVGSSTGLAELLLNQGRDAEALQLTTPLVAAANADVVALVTHAEILKQGGRYEEALAFVDRAKAAGAPFADLERSTLLGELGRYDEAEAAARDGFARVGEHPAAFATLGRALQRLGRYEEAEEAFRRALTRAPFDPHCHQALAELLWARTGDPERAATPLDSVLRQQPTAPLLALRAKLHTRAGHPDRAFALLDEAAKQAPNDPLLRASAATAAVFAGHADEGLVHAEAAVALAPGVLRIQNLLAETCMAAGQPERGAAIAERLVKTNPADQQYLALLAVSRRLAGDPRYREIYDYDTMVQAFDLPTPEGWPSIEAYLADLGRTLHALHAMRGEPLEQSLRNGVQTEQNLALSSDPVIQAFFKAAETPIAEFVKGLGKGSDPFRARNQGGFRVRSAWSARLNPDGFHADHIHPDGWISSAFYVELPKAVDGEGREGWIKFGQPGLPTRPPLEAEHFVKPKAGRLVLFPSYMWHGTVPFSGDETRMTMAFDISPAR